MGPHPSAIRASPPVVLVTGASRGIGAAIARRLAAEGFRVWLGARTVEACRALADQLASEGGQARALELDVTDPASVGRAVEAVGPGGLDGLVNNAGVAESAPLLPRAGREAAHEDLYRRHLEVNFHGARRMVEAFVPAMVERGRGRVVQIGSSAALHGAAYIAAYAASKFALLGYTLCAATELSPKGVAFHAVCPHYVQSPMLEASVRRLVDKTGRTEEEARAFFAAQNPGGRIVEPEEVASAVLALLESEETGLVVELDGSDDSVVHRHGIPAPRFTP